MTIAIIDINSMCGIGVTDGALVGMESCLISLPDPECEQNITMFSRKERQYGIILHYCIVIDAGAVVMH